MPCCSIPIADSGAGALFKYGGEVMISVVFIFVGDTC